MKGFECTARTLAELKRGQRSIMELAEAVGIRYVSMMWLIAELCDSGLVFKVGTRPSVRGFPSVLYAFKDGEAQVVGRHLTRKFLRIWNALQEPDSAAQIAQELGTQQHTVGQALRTLRQCRLCRIGGWQRNVAGQPTALHVLGDRPDAPRPKPYTNTEQCRRWYARRGEKALHSALMFRWPVVREPEKEAA